ALILIDARNGLLEQSRRHAFLASLLGIPHLVVCINKMDLVGFSQERFGEIRTELGAFANKLEVKDLTFMPMSALGGDNVVERSAAMPWYEGVSLLNHLEELHVASDRNLIDARFPVQYVIRGAASNELPDFRGYAGTVAGGTFKPGDEVTVLPSGFSTTVDAIWGPGGVALDEAFAGQSVAIELNDDVDIARGDLIARPANRPQVAQEIDATLCWFDAERQLDSNRTYSILHTTHTTRASIKQLDYRLDINTLHRDETARTLALNEIGRVSLRTQTPLLFDPYRRNRDTGSFILIDETTNNTVAAGMILGPSLNESNVTWHGGAVTRQQRASRGMTVWLTGLSGSGKSSIAVELERRLVAAGRPAYRLDGDNLRHGLNSDMGFSAEDRAENVRRVSEVAKIVADAGVVAIVSLVSPYRAGRDAARAQHAADELPFLEVFVDTPLEVCEARDAKELYRKARAGEIAHFTGISAPYEAPLSPDLLLRPGDGDAGSQADLIVDLIDGLAR
ncbi:MAG TPA: adenylyl-sulfate kinase, partial [Nitrolancea sp.]|nr:adenylyl-sulfate kinase [Nitrolancea sp.]